MFRYLRLSSRAQLVLKLDAFAATLLAIVLAELGDKTQLLAVAIATRTNPLIAFSAATLGFVAANMLAIPLGAALQAFLDPRMLRIAAGLLFVAVGIVTLLGREKNVVSECGFTKGFCLMFLAELGDKTNLATVALAASTGAIAEVALGVTAAAIVLMALATTLGSALASHLPHSIVKKITGALFTTVGALLIASVLRG